MILDKLSESACYEALHPRFAEAFAFLREIDGKENGRYELGGGMFVNLSEVATHPAGQIDLEAHRKYIDIQYLLSGHSACGWANLEGLDVTVPFDADKDVAFYRGERLAVPVKGGMFYILYPGDAHEPHCTDGEPSAYRVAVVKVPIA